MENVELVAAICPNCGAKLQLPENLTKAHCIYCGNEFIISEKKPDIHYHMGEKIGTIENYVKLAINSIMSGDMARAKDYFHKAKEINIEKADKVIEGMSETIAKSYLILAMDSSKKIYDAPLFYMDAYGNSNSSTIDLFSQNADIAWKNGLSFIPPDNKLLLSDAWVIAAQLKIPEKKGPFRDSPKYINAINEDSKTCLNKALEYNPENKDAISMLKELGDSCKTCKGSGKCIFCKESNKCPTCNGTGRCQNCDGSGKTSGLFGKEKACKICNGSGSCSTCKGNKICINCKGKLVCPVCKGRGL